MQKEPGWTGRADRSDVDLAGVVTRRDGTELSVQVINMSLGGCRIHCERQLSIGERVTLDLPGQGRWRANVRWALMESAGLQFGAYQELRD